MHLESGGFQQHADGVPDDRVIVDNKNTLLFIHAATGGGEKQMPGTPQTRNRCTFNLRAESVGP